MKDTTMDHSDTVAAVHAGHPEAEAAIRKRATTTITPEHGTVA